MEKGRLRAAFFGAWLVFLSYGITLQVKVILRRIHGNYAYNKWAGNHSEAHSRCKGINASLQSGLRYQRSGRDCDSARRTARSLRPNPAGSGDWVRANQVAGHDRRVYGADSRIFR